MADEVTTTTRVSYDAIAEGYADRFRDEYARRPLDRALLAAFAEQVGAGVIADVGSGPGEVTAYLESLGTTVVGIDLSPKMIAVARREHPELRLVEATMTNLPIADGSIAGVLAMYSIIHIAEGQLPTVFAEFHRVLAPGGHLMVAFQVGDDVMHYEEAFGWAVSLDFRRLQPERITHLLRRAGFTMRSTTVREPVDWESTRQAYLFATRA